MNFAFLEKSNGISEEKGIFSCTGRASNFNGFSEILDFLKKINENTKTEIISNFLNEISLFIFEKAESLSNQELEEFFSLFIPKFNLITTNLQFIFISEIISELITQKNFISKDLLSFFL